MAQVVVVATRGGAAAPGVTILLSTTLGQLDVRIGLDRFLGVQAQPDTIAGAQTTTVQAVLLEGNGAPVSGAVVSFSTTLGTLGATQVVTNGQGVATTTLRSDGRFGLAVVGATVPGVAGASTTVRIRPTYVISLVANPAQITSSGRSTITIAVIALDPSASVARLTLQVVSSLGRIETPVVTSSSGQATTTLTADGRTGTATVTVTLHGGAAEPATVAVHIQ